MEILTFLYNIFLIVLYTAVLSLTLILYAQKKRPLFLIIAVLFLFFIFDNTVIYMTEFLDVFSQQYDLQFMNVPAFKTVIILVSCFCFSRIQHEFLPSKTVFPDIICLIILALALLFIPMFQDGALSVWFYYLPCQIYTLYIGFSGLFYLKKHPDSILPAISTAYHNLLLITIIFSVLIVIEDSIVIFSFDIYSDIMVKINNRSTSEDIMSILYSFFALRYLFRLIQSDCPETAMTHSEPMTENKNSAISEEDVILFHFANQYQLTSREQEILKILLDDKNNQEISDELFISIGTVKTHVHNIFQKTSVSKRSQMLRLYADYRTSLLKGETPGTTQNS